MSIIDGMIQELQQEALGTRKCLERVPVEHFAWTPHPKSMTLGRLASHIAESPSWMNPIMDLDVFDWKQGDYQPFVAASREELLKTFDEAVANAVASATGRSDEHLLKTWTMTMDGHTIISLPRAAVVRSFILSHMVHHRGQLTVYLRLKEVPLPSLYGPSADEQG
jgi:uncharacterized damage-inducible protein DinB